MPSERKRTINAFSRKVVKLFMMSIKDNLLLVSILERFDSGET